MSPTQCSALKNGEAVKLDAIPRLSGSVFREWIAAALDRGLRISSLFGIQPEGESRPLLVAVLADKALQRLLVSCAETDGYPSLTPDYPQAHMFERELAEQWGIIPRGHPWLRPARFQRSYRGAGVFENNTLLPGAAEFFKVDGAEIHEVAVGPVHAGVIEPGHFRFQCYGENVHHLEISLGYQHRGIEKALLGGPHKRTPYQIETIAGDTTIGHMTAYCQALEALSGETPSPRAQALRAVGLELERLANHTGDLGALAGDVGYLPTAAYCGRIRGDFLNMTALLCGSRLGRSLVLPGGVRFDIEPERRERLISLLGQAQDDASEAIKLLWKTPAVMSRFEHTGSVTLEDCKAVGLVGPAARACGADLDVRRDFPFGFYKTTQVKESVEFSERNGDVFSRAFMRWVEIQNSLSFCLEISSALPDGALLTPEAHGISQRLRGGMLVVSLVEGWRGEICHTAVTDQSGRFAHYKVVDP